MTKEPMWEGVEGAYCYTQAHRTTGIRAWCSICSEWCYCTPENHCRGCLIHAQGFNLDVRDDLEVSNIVRYKSGTIQITMKKR